MCKTAHEQQVATDQYNMAAGITTQTIKYDHKLIICTYHNTSIFIDPFCLFYLYLSLCLLMFVFMSDGINDNLTIDIYSLNKKNAYSSDTH